MAAEELHVAAEAVHVAAENDVLGNLGINLKLFIAQLVNFGIVLLVLWRFAYKPIVRLLDERSNKIEKSLKQAEEIEQRMKDSEIEREEIITKAKQESRVILEEANTKAQEKHDQTIAKTKNEVEAIVVHGKEKLVHEQEAMVVEAKKEIATVVAIATEKVLEGHIDSKLSNKLAEDAVKSIK